MSISSLSSNVSPYLMFSRDLYEMSNEDYVALCSAMSYVLVSSLLASANLM